MLLKTLKVDHRVFTAGTGWQLKPEGACKGAVCIPCDLDEPRIVDVAAMAKILGMPLIEEPDFGVWALGPESIDSRALTDAEAPELCLPDIDGNDFRLSSLKGKKVIVYAWAPY